MLKPSLVEVALATFLRQMDVLPAPLSFQPDIVDFSDAARLQYRAKDPRVSSDTRPCYSCVALCLYCTDTPCSNRTRERRAWALLRRPDLWTPKQSTLWGSEHPAVRFASPRSARLDPGVSSAPSWRGPRLRDVSAPKGRIRACRDLLRGFLARPCHCSIWSWPLQG